MEVLKGKGGYLVEKEMNILIMGASGSGKSKVGDLIRNTVFKMDPNSKIATTDPDRENKIMGEGKNDYNIVIKKVPSEELISYCLPPDILANDVIIILTSGAAGRWFQEMSD